MKRENMVEPWDDTGRVRRMVDFRLSVSPYRKEIRLDKKSKFFYGEKRLSRKGVSFESKRVHLSDVILLVDRVHLV